MGQFSWLNLDITDFTSLLEDESDLTEEPVSLDVFYHDTKYLNMQSELGPLQAKLITMMSQIYYPHTLTELYGEEEAMRIWNEDTKMEIVAMLGKGCHAPWSKIYSPSLGYKTSKELSLLASNFDIESGWGAKRATPTFNRGHGEILRITTKKGYHMDVYRGHILMAAAGSSNESMNLWKRGIGGRKLNWTAAHQLSVGDIVPIRVGWTEPYKTFDIDINQARIVGYMLGDGTLPNSQTIPALTNDTKEVQDDFCSVVIEMGDKISNGVSGYGCPKFSVSGGNLTKLLRSLNLDKNPHEEKPWSDAFMSFSDSALIEVIKGLWATDGWVSVQSHNGGYSISSAIDLTSRSIVKGIHIALARLGIFSKFSLQKPDRNNGKHKAVWRCSIIDANSVRKFLSLLGDIPGKTDAVKAALSAETTRSRVVQDSDGFYWDRIESIESLGDFEYYDIQVEDNHSYVLDGFVNHNSGKDFSSRIAFLYTIYKLHCLRDPLKYYNKAPGTYIDLLNIAINADQALQVFFEPLKNIMRRSDWFQEQGYNEKKNRIDFDMSPIRLFSGNSEAESWEGLDLFLCVLDEIAAFKGLGPNVPVLTPNGWVRNGDLSIGDYVIGQNGKPVLVEGIFPMGNKEVFEVEFEDGTTAQCSDDHIWNVREYSDGRRPSVKNLQLKDFKSLTLKGKYNQKRYAIPVVEPVEFTQSSPLPIDPYVLGILISEGSLGQAAKFSSGDPSIVKEVRNRVNFVAEYGGIEYGIPLLCQPLRDLELLGTRSETKFIPDQYLYASVENRKLLLAGLMDGDGTPARGHGSYTTVSTKLKDDILELCRGLGGVPTATRHKAWYKNTNGERVECQDKWMICPRVPFNPFMLKRKADRWKPHKRTLWRSVVAVRPLGYKEEITCIKVANDDGLYVINDYIVTHNTEQAFKSAENSQRLSAKAIYDMAEASITSRFPDIGKLILLSFPRYRGDFIMQRYEDAANYPDKVFRLKATPWEVNPTKTRDMYEHYYRKNPIEAKARFECEPPEMVDAFFRDPQMVRRCFDGAVSMVDGKEVYKEIPALFPYDSEGRWRPWFDGQKDDFTRYIHVDLAKGTRDRAALAMVHVSGLREVETEPGNWQKLPVVKMDLVKWWEAKPGEEINFSSIRECILDLQRKFPVGLVTFDQWQSIDMIQNLKSRGIRAERQPVNVNCYDTLATCFYDQRFSGYFVNLLVEEELLRLQLLPNGKVDHPDDGTKDLSDALAGAVWSACKYADLDQEIDIDIIGLDEEWEDWERLDAEQDEAEDRRANIASRRIYTSQLDDFELQVI